MLDSYLASRTYLNRFDAKKLFSFVMLSWKLQAAELDVEVYMAPMFVNQYKLLARAGNRVQEVEAEKAVPRYDQQVRKGLTSTCSASWIITHILFGGLPFPYVRKWSYRVLKQNPYFSWVCIEARPELLQQEALAVRYFVKTLMSCKACFG
ncbi:hypothetical protein Bca4012_058417 [Brassica carinata]|uniref:Uncharacterized protein n=1 Tax=Brassica carinata TaxID=52824 RepID=A0A8X7W4M2_BRACI|nr:hypothetical protein Bca52824_016182 [Brassica carinata]